MSTTQKKRIVILVSGGGSNLQAIIDATEKNTIHGVVAGVISNRADAYALTRAQQHHIPSNVIINEKFPNREEFDDRLLESILSFQPDLVLLAGFMRVLGANLVKHLQGRMLNVHPSLLPKFPGLHTHRKALAKSCTQHGCSVHFVTPELDAGPIVLQAAVPVLPQDSEESLAARVLEKEHIIYPLCASWFCEGNLALKDDSVWVHNQKIDQPLQLKDIAP